MEHRLMTCSNWRACERRTRVEDKTVSHVDRKERKRRQDAGRYAFFTRASVRYAIQK